MLDEISYINNRFYNIIINQSNIMRGLVNISGLP